MKIVKKCKGDSSRWQLDLRDAVRDLRMIDIPRKATKEEKDVAKRYIQELESLTRSLKADVGYIDVEVEK